VLFKDGSKEWIQSKPLYKSAKETVDDYTKDHPEIHLFFSKGKRVT